MARVLNQDDRHTVIFLQYLLGQCIPNGRYPRLEDGKESVADLLEVYLLHVRHHVLAQLGLVTPAEKSDPK